MCPYPTRDEEGNKNDGFLVSQSRVCAKCNKNCLDFISGQLKDIEHFVCDKGLSLVSLVFPYGTVYCYGLLVKIKNQECPAKTRKLVQAQKIAWEDIVNWREKLKSQMSQVEQLSEAKAIELVNGLHNIKTTVSLITRNSEAIISELKGDTVDDKIDNADKPLRALLKSVQLLHSHLKMTSILSNPESASFGQRHPSPVYKIFHKMVRVFEETAAQNYKFIRMNGSSHNTPRCYDSLESLALVLIDNAVKYTKRGGRIDVYVYDAPSNGVSVEVRSEGLLVPKEMEERIFQRGVRCKNAKEYASTGSGFGLYIATIIANAHGISIKYNGQTNIGQGEQGINIFSFEIIDKP